MVEVQCPHCENDVILGMEFLDYLIALIAMKSLSGAAMVNHILNVIQYNVYTFMEKKLKNGLCSSPKNKQF